MDEHRRHKRSRILWTGVVLHGPGLLTVDGVIRDANNHGARMKLATAAPLTPPVYLLVVNKGKLLRSSVEWSMDDEVGLKFEEDVGLEEQTTHLQRVARRLLVERTAR